MRNSFDNFLHQLELAMNLPHLPIDPSGGCGVNLGTGLFFQYDDQLVPNTILVSSFIGKLPTENRNEILIRCLKQNSFTMETLSCKPDEDKLYLHRRIHPDLEGEQLKETITTFVDQTKKAKGLLQAAF